MVRWRGVHVALAVSDLNSYIVETRLTIQISFCVDDSLYPTHCAYDMGWSAVIHADSVFHIADAGTSACVGVDVRFVDIAVMPPIVVQGFKRCGNVLCVNLGVP